MPTAQQLNYGKSSPVNARRQGASLQLNGNNDKRSRIVHRVKEGETLFAIAANYKTMMSSIRDWNNLPQNDNLKVGDRLTIYPHR